MGTNHGGVNFGRRLPPIGGQYSTPINTLHQGRFDIRNGKALDGPVSDDVTSYPVKVEGGFVLIEYGELASPDSG